MGDVDACYFMAIAKGDSEQNILMFKITRHTHRLYNISINFRLILFYYKMPQTRWAFPLTMCTFLASLFAFRSSFFVFVFVSPPTAIIIQMIRNFIFVSTSQRPFSFSFSLLDSGGGKRTWQGKNGKIYSPSKGWGDKEITCDIVLSFCACYCFISSWRAEKSKAILLLHFGARRCEFYFFPARTPFMF